MVKETCRAASKPVCLGVLALAGSLPTTQLVSYSEVYTQET